ncbi:MAG: hypothetical protein AB7I18_12650 [Candidatus Berkiella sp.]
MRISNTIKMAALALILGLLSLIALPAQAEFFQKRVIDVDHLLNENTRVDLEALLSQTAKEGRADLTVFVVNQDTQEPKEYAKKLINEWEVRHPHSDLQHKRGYLVFNTSIHQAVIVLNKEVRVDNSLECALKEIQQKILTPRLLEEQMNTSIFRACAAMVGALEDWPSASGVNPFSHFAFITFLKWMAQLSLVGAAIIGLQVLFSRPKWHEMPLGDETSKLYNEEVSLSMSMWRSHRHIESV